MRYKTIRTSRRYKIYVLSIPQFSFVLYLKFLKKSESDDDIPSDICFTLQYIIVVIHITAYKLHLTFI